MALAGAPQTSVGPDRGREDPSPAWGPLTLAGTPHPRGDPTLGSRPHPCPHPCPSGPAEKGPGPPDPHPMSVSAVEGCVVFAATIFAVKGGFGFVNVRIEIAETGFMEAWLN